MAGDTVSGSKMGDTRGGGGGWVGGDKKMIRSGVIGGQ